MTYQIIRTDGTFVTMVPDLTVNTTAMPINLFGKGYANYGEALNENFVSILENFASPVAPVNPVRGQLWYDVSNDVLKVQTADQLWKVLSFGNNTGGTLQSLATTNNSGHYTPSALSTPGADSPLTAGIQLANTNAATIATGSSAFWAIGPTWRRGFTVTGIDPNGGAAFVAGDHTGNYTGFYSAQTNGYVLRNAPNDGVNSVVILPSGSMQLGSSNIAEAVSVQYNTSGFGNDYDARFVFHGGTSGISGMGTLDIAAGAINFPSGTITIADAANLIIGTSNVDNNLTIGSTILKARSGSLKMAKITSGITDRAVVQSVFANVPGDPVAQVCGYVPGLSALSYGDIDSVASYGHNFGREPFFIVSSPTFSTAIMYMPLDTPLTDLQIGQLFHGMHLVTSHTQRWMGFVDTWDTHGAWVTVIGGWGLAGVGGQVAGNNPTGSPFTGTLKVAFAPLTKIWADNSNVILGPPISVFTPAKTTGYELGVINNSGVDHGYLGDFDPRNAYSWGFDSTNLGSNRASSAFIARGRFDTAFHARAGEHAAFFVDGLSSNGFGFLSTQTTGSPFCHYTANGGNTFFLTGNGSIEMGPVLIASTPFIDMHSSGTNNDYDVRFIASGGNINPGQGDLDIIAGSIYLDTKSIRSPAANVKLGGSGWLEAIIGGTEAISNFTSLSTNGGPALVLGTKTSLSPNYGQGGFSLGAFAINDNTTTQSTVYGIYAETRRYPGTGPSQNIEMAIVNLGDVHARTPYTVTSPGDTINLLIDPGRNDAGPTVNDCTIAMFLGSSGTYNDQIGTPRHASFLTGIGFHANSIRPNIHPGFVRSVAIDMCFQHSLVWRSPVDASIVSYITSDVITGKGGNISFISGGISLGDANNNSILQVLPNQTITYGNVVQAADNNHKKTSVVVLFETTSLSPVSLTKDGGAVNPFNVIYTPPLNRSIYMTGNVHVYNGTSGISAVWETKALFTIGATISTATVVGTIITPLIPSTAPAGYTLSISISNTTGTIDVSVANTNGGACFWNGYLTLCELGQ